MCWWWEEGRERGRDCRMTPVHLPSCTKSARVFGAVTWLWRPRLLHVYRYRPINTWLHDLTLTSLSSDRDRRMTLYILSEAGCCYRLDFPRLLTPDLPLCSEQFDSGPATGSRLLLTISLGGHITSQLRRMRRRSSNRPVHPILE